MLSISHFFFKHNNKKYTKQQLHKKAHRLQIIAAILKDMNQDISFLKTEMKKILQEIDRRKEA